VRNLRGRVKATIGQSRPATSISYSPRALEGRTGGKKSEAASLLKQILTPYLSSRMFSSFLHMLYELTLDSPSRESVRTRQSPIPGFELAEEHDTMRRMPSSRELPPGLSDASCEERKKQGKGISVSQSTLVVHHPR
jgi:hypothetical protein